MLCFNQKMETIGERIRFARKLRKMSQQELADACLWDSQGRISNYENNARSADVSEYRVLARALRVNLAWLLTGEGEMEETKEGLTQVITHPAKPVLAWDEENPLPEGEFVLIPRLDVELSAGNGTVIYDVDEKQPHAFRADWLLKRKLRPDNICLMYAKGDSMEDYIQDGDTLLVDVKDKTVIDNVVYALRYGDELRVKRLFKRPDGGLRIVSDNKKYPEEIISAADVNAYIDILGRIVWRGG